MASRRVQPIVPALLFTVAFTVAGSAFAAETLKIRSYWDPGVEYLRAGESGLAKAGVTLAIDDVEGEWTAEKPILQRPDVMKAVASGQAVTTSPQRLTKAQRAQGLDERVLGMYAGVLVANPEAPLTSVSLAKWKKAITTKDTSKLKWSDLGDVPAGKDGPVALVLPDATHRGWAASLGYIGVLSPGAIAAFPAKPSLAPLDAVMIAAADKSKIALFGYNLILGKMTHPLHPVKLLPVDGVAPTEATIADGSYPFARPYLMQFAKSAAQGNGAIAKTVHWLDEGTHAAEVARSRLLVPVAKGPGAAAAPKKG